MRVFSPMTSILALSLLAACNSSSAPATSEDGAKGASPEKTAKAAPERPAREEKKAAPETDDINWVSGEECLAAIKNGASPVKKTIDGYWTNDANVVIGKWELGAVAFFDTDENGKDEIVMDFDDVTSPTNTNELGQEYHENNDRVVVSQCHFEEPAIKLKGKGEKMGDVSLSGDFNIKMLEDSNLEETGQENNILIGTLKVDGSAKPVVLGYFIGD